MPVISAGVWQYTPEQAQKAVEEAIKAGFTHIDTAYDYSNQQGVAKGLKSVMQDGKPRDSIFVTTKVPGCGAQNVSAESPEQCGNDTVARIQDDLSQLELEKIDLLLVHFPPCVGPSPEHMNTSVCFVNKTGCTQDQSCAMIKAQWGAVVEAYKKGSLRAIGVSNYCSKCLDCLAGEKVQPMVNQVHYQVGMGPDPQGFKTRAGKLGMALQAWSPLGMGGGGSDAIMRGNLTTSIGKKHGKSAVQVALKWIVSQNVTVSTKSMNPVHLKENLALFDFELDEEDMHMLSEARFGSAGEPSFLCQDGPQEPALSALAVI